MENISASAIRVILIAVMAQSGSIKSSHSLSLLQNWNNYRRDIKRKCNPLKPRAIVWKYGTKTIASKFEVFEIIVSKEQ